MTPHSVSTQTRTESTVDLIDVMSILAGVPHGLQLIWFVHPTASAASARHSAAVERVLNFGVRLRRSSDATCPPSQFRVVHGVVEVDDAALEVVFVE